MSHPTCAASHPRPVHLTFRFLCSCVGRPSEKTKRKRCKKTLVGMNRPKKTKVTITDPAAACAEVAAIPEKQSPSPSSRSSSRSCSPASPREALGLPKEETLAERAGRMQRQHAAAERAERDAFHCPAACLRVRRSLLLCIMRRWTSWVAKPVLRRMLGPWWRVCGRHCVMLDRVVRLQHSEWRGCREQACKSRDCVDYRARLCQPFVLASCEGQISGPLLSQEVILGFLDMSYVRTFGPCA